MVTTRKFSRDIKAEAVTLVKDRGVSVQQATRDLDIHENVLRKRILELAEDGVRHIEQSSDLRRDGVDMKFGFCAKHRGTWSLALMCEALDVSRSRIYAWFTRPTSQRSMTDEVLGMQVRQSFVDCDRTYVARWVWHDVLAVGSPCTQYHCRQRT